MAICMAGTLLQMGATALLARQDELELLVLPSLVQLAEHGHSRVEQELHQQQHLGDLRFRNGTVSRAAGAEVPVGLLALRSEQPQRQQQQAQLESQAPQEDAVRLGLWTCR